MIPGKWAVKPRYPIGIAGLLKIPEGVTEIGSQDFRWDHPIRKLVVPASVKVIRDRAFSMCETLEEVVFSEGLEGIESWAFSQCTGLKRVKIPDSVTHLEGWGFSQCSGLEEPVFNASGTVLYYCPAKAAGKRYAVPAGVRKIAGGAFIACRDLEELTIPEGVEEIGRQAFHCLKIRELHLPASLKRLGEFAFCGCKELERVTAEDISVFDRDSFYQCQPRLECRKKTAQDQYLRAVHGSFLEKRKCTITGKEMEFVSREPNRSLTRACAKGDRDAMYALSQAFRQGGEGDFYQLAANFWLYRASRYGQSQAKGEMEDWYASHPGQRMPALMRENFRGHYGWELLRALGFSFFPQKAHTYYLNPLGEDGVVLVSLFSYEEGPDEGGFGWGDIYYDYWCLDSCLNYYPELGYIHNSSDLKEEGRRYENLRSAVARKSRGLPKME